MYYRVVGRKEIISPSRKTIHNDEGRRALNGIDYGKVEKVDEMTEKVAKLMKEEFLILHPFYSDDEMKIEMVLDCKE